MGMFSDALMETETFDLPEDEKPPAALVKDFQQESKQLQLGLSLEQTTGVNPDEHAEAMDLSKDVQLPPDSIRQDLPAYREQVRKEKVDYSQLLKEHPKLSQSLTDPDFAKISADDLDNLSTLERILTQGVVDPVIAIAGKAPVAFGQSLVGLTDLAVGQYKIDPLNPFKSLLAIVGQSAGVIEGDSVGDYLEENIGYKPEEAQQALNKLLSPETLKSMQNVERAEGLVGTISAYATNPAALSQDVLTSWPIL